MGSWAPSTSAVHWKVTPSASLTPLGQATLPTRASGILSRSCLLIVSAILAGSTVWLPPILILAEQPASKAAASSSVMVVARRPPWPPVAGDRTKARGVGVSPRVAVLRLVMAGTGKPPPAVRRGEGRVPRDVMCARRAGVQPARDGAAAAATSSDDAPCPTGRGSGSLASRSAVLAGNATPCLVVEKEANVEVIPGFRGIGRHRASDLRPGGCWHADRRDRPDRHSIATAVAPPRPAYQRGRGAPATGLARHTRSATVRPTRGRTVDAAVGR